MTAHGTIKLKLTRLVRHKGNRILLSGSDTFCCRAKFINIEIVEAVNIFENDFYGIAFFNAQCRRRKRIILSRDGKFFLPRGLSR